MDTVLLDESTSSLNAVRRKEVKLQIHTRIEPCTPDWFSVITSLASSRALMCREVDESGSSKSAAISFKCFSFSALEHASFRRLFSHQDEKLPLCTSMVFRFSTST